MKTTTGPEADKMKGEYPQESNAEFGSIIGSSSYMIPQDFAEELIETKGGREDANCLSTLKCQSPQENMMENIYEHIQ